MWRLISVPDVWTCVDEVVDSLELFAVPDVWTCVDEVVDSFEPFVAVLQLLSKAPATTTAKTTRRLVARNPMEHLMSRHAGVAIHSLDDRGTGLLAGRGSTGLWDRDLDDHT
jgi:hypothetical protein